MATFRKLRNAVLGLTMDDAKTQAQLIAAGVPTSEADCRTCSIPCEEGEQRILGASAPVGLIT
jgi:hypothetical protein